MYIKREFLSKESVSGTVVISTLEIDEGIFLNWWSIELLLAIKPKTGVQISPSGCSLESGNYYIVDCYEKGSSATS